MNPRVLLAALVAVALSGVRSATPQAPQVERGKRLYDVYCRSCHGESARGDGPAARYLDVPPADLTDLETRNGGRFPSTRIQGVIDGRHEVLGHGTRRMPIWGLTFQEPEADANQEDEVSAKIQELIDYLESIQKPAGERGAGGPSPGAP